MADVPSVLKQINNHTNSNPAGLALSRAAVAVANQSVEVQSHDMVYVGPREWGYMSLENIRPVYVDEEVTLNPYAAILYGCVLPLFAVLTLCTNCLTCVVLTQKDMRSATGCLLIAMALSDMSMAVWPLPPFFYFFTMGNHREWVPHSWCYASLWMLEFLPTIFHATSIWLMVALAGQRYLAICQPLQTQRWCVSTSPGSIQCAVVIFILAMGSQLSRIFESDFSPKTLPSRIYPNVHVQGCSSEFAPFVSAFTEIYFKVYFCFKTLVIHVIPCVMVLYLAICICCAKAKAHYRSQKRIVVVQSFRSRIKEYWIKMAEVKYSTGLILAFILLFILVEVPLAAFYAIELLQDKMVFEFNVLPSDMLTSMILFANMSTVIVSPLKILIFCAFCSQFRDNLEWMYDNVKTFCKCDDEDDDEV